MANSGVPRDRDVKVNPAKIHQGILPPHCADKDGPLLWLAASYSKLSRKTWKPASSPESTRERPNFRQDQNPKSTRCFWACLTHGWMNRDPDGSINRSSLRWLRVLSAMKLMDFENKCDNSNNRDRINSHRYYHYYISIKWMMTRNIIMTGAILMPCVIAIAGNYTNVRCRIVLINLNT